MIDPADTDRCVELLNQCNFVVYKISVDSITFFTSRRPHKYLLLLDTLVTVVTVQPAQIENDSQLVAHLKAINDTNASLNAYMRAELSTKREVAEFRVLVPILTRDLAAMTQPSFAKVIAASIEAMEKLLETYRAFREGTASESEQPSVSWISREQAQALIGAAPLKEKEASRPWDDRAIEQLIINVATLAQELGPDLSDAGQRQFSRLESEELCATCSDADYSRILLGELQEARNLESLVTQHPTYSKVAKELEKHHPARKGLFFEELKPLLLGWPSTEVARRRELLNQFLAKLRAPVFESQNWCFCPIGGVELSDIDVVEFGPYALFKMNGKNYEAIIEALSSGPAAEPRALFSNQRSSGLAADHRKWRRVNDLI